MGSSIHAHLCYCLEPWESGALWGDEETDREFWLAAQYGATLPQKDDPDFWPRVWELERTLPVTIQDTGTYQYSEPVLCARRQDEDRIDPTAMAEEEPALHAALLAFCERAGIPLTNPGWRIVAFYG